VEYGTADGQKLLMDINVPKGWGPFPIVMLVHGGGWVSGDKAKDIVVLFGPLEKAKFEWVSINYRLAPKYRWPACMEDVQTAMRFMKKHAGEFNGDADRMAMFCYSASGLPVLRTVEGDEKDLKVAAVVALAPNTDFEIDLAQRGGLSPSLQKLLGEPKIVTEESRAKLRELAPINHVRAGMPPMLMIQGDADKTIPPVASENFVKKMREFGNECDLVIIKGGVHNILKNENGDTSYKGKMIEWLKEKLGWG
jgi:acetyl esterase/lipase